MGDPRGTDGLKGVGERPRERNLKKIGPKNENRRNPPPPQKKKKKKQKKFDFF